MYSNLKRLLLILLVSFIAFQGWAQEVWPGDVNNNGIVDNVDWIYLSNAFDEIGPARPIGEQGIEWEAKMVTTLWGINFPGTSIDYAYADCNGDGFIDEGDFEAIAENMGETHGIIDPDEPVLGTGGIDPELFLLDDPIIPFPQGGVLFLELYLGTIDLPVEDFSGIAFDIVYDPDIIQEMLFFPLEEDEGWGQYGLFAFQQESDTEGILHVAFSALGIDEITDASGLLGRLFIVIEDDVVGMQGGEIETTIELENVILLGEELDISPVLNDTIDVTVVENPLSTEDFVDAESIEVFPNPASDFVYFKTDHKVDRIEIFNTLGKRIISVEGDHSMNQRVDLSNLAVGIHLFKFHTDEGVLTKKLIIH